MTVVRYDVVCHPRGSQYGIPAGIVVRRVEKTFSAKYVWYFTSNETMTICYIFICTWTKRNILNISNQLIVNQLTLFIICQAKTWGC